MAVPLLASLPPPWVLVDTWGHLAFGRLVVESHVVAQPDPFAYVPTQDPWIYHWLSDVVIYLTVHHLGADALLALRACLWLATFALLYATARRRGSNVWVALGALLVAATPISWGFGFFRPQAFSYFLFSLELYVLATADAGRPRTLLWLVPMMALWSNLHGGMVAGLGVLWAYACGRIVGRPTEEGLVGWAPLAAVAATASIATVLTPWGVDSWLFLLEAAALPRPHVTEWGSLVTLPKSPLTTVSTLALLTAAAIVATPLKRDAAALSVLGATFAAGAWQVRHLPFFGIAVAAVLPAFLSRPSSAVATLFLDAVRRRFIVRPTVVRFAVVAVAVSLALFAGRDTFGSALWTVRTSGRAVAGGPSYPFGAVEFIRQNGLGGNIATPYTWGEFVIWKLYPICRVSIDSRYETAYGQTVATDNWSFMFGEEGWERLLSEYATDLVLTNRSLPHDRLMRLRTDWRLVFEDELSALFVPNLAKFEREWVRPEGLPATFP